MMIFHEVTLIQISSISAYNFLMPYFLWVMYNANITANNIHHKIP